ncbi:hypothetical protein M422DRAFT_777758 [Sphaerobolus stellatus SS14]|nr:hypothetical protein M422DRAFT_777758 [Sphaerobolus stellatus SS14]
MVLSDYISRLPANVRPLHYDLVLKTDLESTTFQGHVTIELEIHEDTSSFIFNYSRLAILETKLCSGGKLLSTEVELNEDKELITVKFAEPLLKKTKATLVIWYEGTLKDDRKGYYLSSYEDNGKKDHYALTQFEPTSARRAFPCWDEPLFKATFDITMISLSAGINISNMPIKSEAPGVPDDIPAKFFKDKSSAGWKITRFHRTPIMSTYLVAFANGPFEYLESSYTSPLTGKVRPLRIYGTRDIVAQGKFVLDVTAKAVPEYEKLFDIGYPLPKLDTLIAHDFDAGAMENWGLIIGRTSFYCLDGKRADVKTKMRIAENQCHEIGHMWFGNITTMAWWDNVWLKEGFATLMGAVIVLNKLHPEWNPYASFYTDYTEEALTLDAKLSSHAVHVPIPDPNNISQIFDSLSYNKAATVLRMLSVYVGEEAFLRGSSIYLKKNLYGNSVAEDLWMGIQEATGINIGEIMDNWISKVGYPVLTITEQPEGIHIRQDRFLSTGIATGEENETIWNVPLNVVFTSPNGNIIHDNKTILTAREMTYHFDVDKPWKINGGGTGFYRVIYSPKQLAKLSTAGGDGLMTVSDRLALISDTMVLSSAGLGDTSGALNIINSWRKEPEYLVWSGIARQLGRLGEILWNDEVILDRFSGFKAYLFMPIVRKLGYIYPEGEDMNRVQLRTLAISVVAGCGCKEVVKTLSGWFAEYQASQSLAHIPPDLVKSTFEIGVRYGGKQEWETVRDAYLNGPTASVKTAAISGLCASKLEEMKDATEDFMMDGVRPQDIESFLENIGSNLRDPKRAYQFFKRNYYKLYNLFEGGFRFVYLMKNSTMLLNTKEDLLDVETFFKDKDMSKLTTSVEQTMDSIRGKVEWRERCAEDVGKWLENWASGNELEEDSVLIAMPLAEWRNLAKIDVGAWESRRETPSGYSTPLGPAASSSPGRAQAQSGARELEGLQRSYISDAGPEMEGEYLAAESPGSQMDISDEDVVGVHPDANRAPKLKPDFDDDVEGPWFESNMSTPRRTSRRTRRVIDYEESAPASPVEDVVEEVIEAAGPSNTGPPTDYSESPGPSSRPSLKIKLKVPEPPRQPVKRGGRRGGRGAGRGRGRAKENASVTPAPARGRGAPSEGSVSSHHSGSRTPSPAHSSPESEDAEGESDPDNAEDDGMDVDAGGMPDEDVEIESEGEGGEDSEVIPSATKGRLTARQAVLASVTGAEHVELSVATSGRKKQLTSEEIALRREETARKRKNMNEKKLEDEKTETINRLLKKQSSRSRAKRAMFNSVVPTPQSPHSGDEAAESDGGGGGGGNDISQGPQRYTIPGPSWRWVSNSAGMRLGIPIEVLNVLEPESQDTASQTQIEESASAPPPSQLEFVKLESPATPKPPAVCDVPGCAATRKYRVVHAFEKGACGMEHLKVLSGKA